MLTLCPSAGVPLALAVRFTFVVSGFSSIVTVIFACVGMISIPEIVLPSLSTTVMESYSEKLFVFPAILTETTARSAREMASWLPVIVSTCGVTSPGLAV